MLATARGRLAKTGLKSWELRVEFLREMMAKQGWTAAQRGFSGVVRRPTLFLAGEAGPEYVHVAPRGRAPAPSLTITGPLVQVMGSADRATAERAAELVKRALRSVLREPTITGGSTERIRFASRLVS